LTLADLPEPDTKRWVIWRKAKVVAAVRGGLLSLEEACSRYGLSSEEVLSWQHRIDHFGMAALRTTRTTRAALRQTGTERPGDAISVLASIRLFDRQQSCGRATVLPIKKS
jgi:hypothetical protein